MVFIIKAAAFEWKLKGNLFSKPLYESQSHFVIEGIEMTSKVKLHSYTQLQQSKKDKREVMPPVQ